jgi:NADH:ubiquinone oxidoreductase subunit 6 (subunit J)
MTKWILPFELVAVLLLVGIVGAVVVAKRRL